MLSKDPPVVMFHDFITDEEINFMKFSKMAEMKVATFDGGKIYLECNPIRKAILDLIYSKYILSL